ncbi:UDP-N-acetylmuramate dehydrogenase [Nakamurella sp. YIM 132087]|uniref:UDP-N-acetylenolpyruvoylglucosamine reductase n=1 Tax=Nakamurella alba TaxID=2665158 RepID=A0A7K1FS15_9ACTN|nr:UDP-N-acetylmuramate dehydrogenase [Nakamurella alba]MTD16149.1 UDP-N-acetylmuramate dehydrogenase [Nakamurella alba]
MPHLPPTTGPDLSGFTTLGLGGPCRGLITVQSPADLAAIVGRDDLLVLGGGSNLVIADAGVDLTVVRIAIPGLRIDGDLVTIGAGVDWDTAVAELVAAGRCGLGPLSGIPGSTGATPVQNVGAYGTEVGDLLHEVTLFDRVTGAITAVPAAQLGLGYRTSVLRGSARHVVTAVTFRLPADPQPVRYAELARVLGVQVGETAPEAEVRTAVLELRRSKGMVLDPTDADTRSAGSFFTNPILDPAAAGQVDARIRDRCGPDTSYPRYPAGEDGELVKLSAAWLIERAGFHKGFEGPGGRVAVSGKHTLALTNRGAGSTADLLVLAREIRDGVLAAFGVELHPEPILVGVTL